jgi:hypothetical protein
VGAPTGYDFSRTPPVVAGANTDAIYVAGSSLVTTNGKLASWNTGWRITSGSITANDRARPHMPGRIRLPS